MLETADFDIRGKLTQIIEPIVDEMKFELVDVEYLSEHGRWVLRIYLDKEGGITLDECARVSREVGDLIDVKDIVEHKYVLEVSSPGLNRPLKREKDFQRAVGKKIKIKMVIPVEGCRHFTGYLRKFQEGTLYLEVENNVVPLSLRDVKRSKVVYEFED
jgi:ribosome maturation factor RimP